MVLAEDGWPVVRPLPPGPMRARQLLVLWEGSPGGDGARSLRFDVVREDGPGAPVVWRSTAPIPQKPPPATPAFVLPGAPASGSPRAGGGTASAIPALVTRDTPAAIATTAAPAISQLRMIASIPA